MRKKDVILLILLCVNLLFIMYFIYFNFLYKENKLEIHGHYTNSYVSNTPLISFDSKEEKYYFFLNGKIENKGYFKEINNDNVYKLRDYNSENMINFLL